MDSGNVNARAAAPVAGEARGERRQSSGDNTGSDNNNFAALIAALLSGAPVQQKNKAASAAAGAAENAAAQKAAGGEAQNAAAKKTPQGVLGALQGEAAVNQVLGAGSQAQAPVPAKAPQITASASKGVAAAASTPTVSADAGTKTLISAPAVEGQTAPARAPVGAEARDALEAAVRAERADAARAGQTPSSGQAPEQGAQQTNNKANGHSAQAGAAVAGATVDALRAAALGAPRFEEKAPLPLPDGKPAASALGASAGADGAVKIADQFSSAPSRPGAQTIAQQVAQNLSFIANNGADRLRFQLHPAELGQVSIQLRIRDGAARVVISAEHHAAVEAMRQAAGSLQQALQNAGLQVDRDSLQFDVQGQNQQQAETDSNRSGGDQQADDQSDFVHRDDQNAGTRERRAREGLFL